MKVRRASLLGQSRMFAMVTLSLVFAGMSANAQRFEDIMGSPNVPEDGRFGVCQVMGGGGGYIAVGTTNSTLPLTGDVYVVRLGLNGLPIWANRYDINGTGVSDVGQGIVECANGDFAITGFTFANGCGITTSVDLFFLRINSAGGVVTTRTYGAIPNEEWGTRIQELTIGNGTTTNAGDFIIAGRAHNAAGSHDDGYLLRVTSMGLPVWGRTYGWTNSDEVLTDVGEATVGGSGDIIAAGWSRDTAHGSVGNGWLLRVNGNTGFISAFPHGSALYGGGVETNFFSVDELTVGINAGNLVAAGATRIANNSGFTSHEYYILKTGANPCSPRMDITHGDLGPHVDQIATIREIIAPAGSAHTNGDLVLCGWTSAWPGGGPNVSLLQLNPNTLTLAPGMYLVYGTPMGEHAYSVAPVINTAGGLPTEGFIICGEMLNPIGTNDPKQMYLLKTNIFGNTLCNDNFPPDSTSVPGYTVNCRLPAVSSLTTNCLTTTSVGMVVGGARLCYWNPKRVEEATEGNEGIEWSTTVESGYPNPVVAGGTFVMEYDPAENGTASIVVTDMAGHVVHSESRECVPGADRIGIATAGWSAGVYMVKVTAGDTSVTRTIVITK